MTADSLPTHNAAKVAGLLYLLNGAPFVFSLSIRQLICLPSTKKKRDHK